MDSRSPATSLGSILGSSAVPELPRPLFYHTEVNTTLSRLQVLPAPPPRTGCGLWTVLQTSRGVTCPQLETTLEHRLNPGLEEDQISSNYLDSQIHFEIIVSVIQGNVFKSLTLVLYLVVPGLVTEHLSTLETRCFTLCRKYGSFWKKFHVYTLTQVDQCQASR